MSLIAAKKDPAVTVRFPEHVLTALRASAHSEGRSLNSQINYLLAQALRLPKPRSQRSVA